MAEGTTAHLGMFFNVVGSLLITLCKWRAELGHSEFDKTKYQEKYIPQKIAALELCVITCYALLSSAEIEPISMKIGGVPFVLPSQNIFVDVAIDAGLVANRVILNFLGFSLKEGKITKVDGSSSDVTAKKSFLLPVITLEEAGKILQPDITMKEEHLILMWSEALQTASKSTAHLTEGGGQIQVARLGFACYATLKLLRKNFLDYAGPELNTPSIIPDEMIPRFGGVWNSVDPKINQLL